MLASVEGPDSLKDFLKAHGLFSKVALAQRQPLARLGLVGGRPALWTPAAQELMDLVYSGAEVRAVSTAPVETLARLHGSFFIYGQRFLEVIYSPHNPEPDVTKPYLRDPAYRRRLVVLRPGTPNQDFDQIQEHDPPDAEPLIVNPQLFELEGDEALKLFSVVSRVALPDAFLLPPTLVEGPEDSYFSEEEQQQPRLETRRELLRVADSDLPSAQEPTLMSLWRVSDEPLLKDLLAEGGSLEITGAASGPTLARLQLFASDPISDYRRRLLLEPAGLPGPRWVVELAAAIRQDIEQLLPGGLPLGPAGLNLNWKVGPTLRSEQPPGDIVGNWHRLEQICKSLGNEELQNYLHGRVLWPSRDRNHDLAERLFISNFCRCPSTSDECQAAWRLALCADLLRPNCEFSGKRLGVKSRMQLWQSGGWPQLSQPLERGPWILQHLSSDGPVDILKWRYLLPLESIITTGAMFQLSPGFNALNRGFVLSR